MMTSYPRFAVVGHPNKGKSSIVAALVHDDTVHISDTPGTTVKSRSFPFRVDGKILYELYDTPGFQRARKVLAWLESHQSSADKKHEVVQAFVDAHRNNPDFRDEVELLEPILKGAGILYVVDASKPYGQEYEAEMEILRYTGQPSMALINHVDNSDYTKEWKAALGYYFKMIRTFNPMQARFAQQLGILESVAQLKEEWTDVVKTSMVLFKQDYAHKIEQSVELIAREVMDCVTHIESFSVTHQTVTQEDKRHIEQHYQDSLRAIEVATQQKIEQLWNHSHLIKEQHPLSFGEMDLFSQKTASIFGLTRGELLIAGATSGATVGAGIDLMFVGHTLLLGAAVGALGGAASAFFGFNELSQIKILGQTLGKQMLQMGPMENRNFPYILLGRALYHAKEVINRSHALRNVADLEMDEGFKEKWLGDEMRKSLEQLHKKFRSSTREEETLEVYRVLITEILMQLVGGVIGGCFRG